MPLIETKGAASAQGFGLTLGSSGPVTYIEDVFSTWLYTGNGSTQTITNGIDLAGKGGMLWIKSRSNAFNHWVVDSARGTGNDKPRLQTNTTAAQFLADSTAFGSSGFTVYGDSDYNSNGATYASWTFRKQPKFFDVVTYTGNGAGSKTINHNLGSVPGCIIVKRLDSTGDWLVYHRGLYSDPAQAYNYFLKLNTTSASSSTSQPWSSAPTSTSFNINSGQNANVNGATYVAYLFAHNAGGFGLTGSDNVISCGSFVWDNVTAPVVNLGYEPQWILYKQSSGIDAWRISDTMRGDSLTSQSYLVANSTATEATDTGLIYPTATGFEANPGGGGQTYIYIAIRRGPMKVPTSGTSVFSPNAVSSSTNSWTTGFPVDMLWDVNRTTGTVYVGDRLRGNNPYLLTSSSNAEASYATSFYFDKPTGTMAQGLYGGALSGIMWNFQRAPGFFDEVCYTGDGTTTQTINHNLTVKPELIIMKSRSQGTLVEAVANWYVWGMNDASNAITSFAVSSTPFAFNSTSRGYISNQSQIVNAANATTFKPYDAMGGNGVSNNSGQTYVAYLFATCAGVSKVGSYTGTGALQTINCGFTGGARFVLIKRTDSTGDWYVWDSARGIVSGNDPYLLLNSTAAEVTNTDYVDTYSAGFEISSTAPAAINANGGTFIFLAIA